MFPSSSSLILRNLLCLLVPGSDTPGSCQCALELAYNAWAPPAVLSFLVQTSSQQLQKKPWYKIKTLPSMLTAGLCALCCRPDAAFTDALAVSTLEPTPGVLCTSPAALAFLDRCSPETISPVTHHTSVLGEVF